MDFLINCDGGTDGGTDVGRSRDAIASKNTKLPRPIPSVIAIHLGVSRLDTDPAHVLIPGHPDVPVLSPVIIPAVLYDPELRACDD